LGHYGTGKIMKERIKKANFKEIREIKRISRKYKFELRIIGPRIKLKQIIKK